MRLCGNTQKDKRNREITVQPVNKFYLMNNLIVEKDGKRPEDNPEKIKTEREYIFVSEGYCGKYPGSC